jgi:integrase/recombinase XerD
MEVLTKKQYNSTYQNEIVQFDKNQDFDKAVKDISLIFRKYGFSYQQTKYVVRQAREKCNLGPEKETKKILPILPSQQELESLLKISEKNPTHWLMLRLLMVCGLRISELINIKKKDIYLDEGKIFINISKTGNRYVLFPKSLRVHLIREIQKTNLSAGYIFISRLHKPFTRKGVWYFIKQYSRETNIEKNLYPHIFRHWWITEMSQVLSEKGLEILSGNKDNLDRYIHLNVGKFKEAYDGRFG